MQVVQYVHIKVPKNMSLNSVGEKGPLKKRSTADCPNLEDK